MLYLYITSFRLNRINSGLIEDWVNSGKYTLSEIEDTFIEGTTHPVTFTMYRDFAQKVKGANIEKLENGLIQACEKCKINDLDVTSTALMQFAKDVKGANVTKLEDAMIRNIKKAGHCPNFAITSFANKVKGADVEKLQDVVMEVGRPTNILYFAQNVEGADIKKLEKSFIDNVNNIEYADSAAFATDQIIPFAKLEGTDTSSLEDLLVRKVDTDHSMNLYTFAKEIEGANIQKLEDRLCTLPPTKPSDYIKGIPYIGETITKFARNIEGANIEKLENAIINTEDTKYIDFFGCLVEGANKQKLTHAIASINDRIK